MGKHFLAFTSTHYNQLQLTTMTIVDKLMGSLNNKEERQHMNENNHKQHSSGTEALADGQPAEHQVDDRIGGTHTRNVKDAVTEENVSRHAHHEVTPVVDRERDETEIHQKVQPVVDNQEHHTHHKHVAPEVSRDRNEDIDDTTAAKYQKQAQFENVQTAGEKTHSTSVNAPKVHEHVNKHIVEEVQPVIQRQTQETEHHHTTQVIHDHAPISMSDFKGDGGNAVGGSHSAHPVVTDER